MNLSYVLQAAAAGTSMTSTLIMMALIFVIFYFFLIRPQNKKQKETERMIAALKKGDKVVTIGGIHGTISSTKEQTVIVKVDDGAKIEFNRSAIATVIADKPAKADKKAKKDKDAAEEAVAEAPVSEENK
ncbi:MAG: preprotein translocase subunit YajC [Treponemataceae bacterium]|nr:preprotein translocase subunit YajC [Treponemataceae bacterium]